MGLRQLKAVHNLDDSAIDLISEAVLTDKGLVETASALGEDVDPCVVYAVAHALCDEVFGEKLDELAPQMAEERQTLIASRPARSLPSDKEKRERSLALIALFEEIAEEMAEDDTVTD